MRIYSYLADVVVLLHVSYVAFVIFGLAAIWIGIGFRAGWFRNFWFRAVHLTMISIVVVEAWVGYTCPLTTWERVLREQAGEASYQGDFVGRWVHELLFMELPPAVFNLMYTLFGLAVLGTFYFAPPMLPWRKTSPSGAGTTK
jgi:hypothetical protein